MRGFALLVAAVLVSIVTSIATVLGMERLKLIAPPPTQAQPSAKVGVPSLKGLSEDDARQNLKALGLVFLVGERKAVSGAGPGTVVEQSPAAGQQVDSHGSVSVALARELPKVPSVVNRTLSEATTLLAQLGYKLEQAEPIADPQVPKGNIVSQLPAAEVAQDTEKPVLVRLSSGPGDVEVPKLLGQGLEKAKTTAKDLGLTLKVAWVERAETETFVVLSENPVPGKKLKPGEAITVAVNH